MYIVAIGWMYVVLMMSISEATPVAGVMTFLLYGAFPVAIILYLLNTPKRRQQREAEKKLRQEAMQARQMAAQADIAVPQSAGEVGAVSAAPDSGLNPDQ
ncbi:MAG: hypothetical protein JO269_10950 [Burkholderiaceae bacterium]|nr:hypothetical protein [Burkholderiaceae bacterium]